jgi:hypothetical protein
MTSDKLPYQRVERFQLVGAVKTPEAVTHNDRLINKL